MNKNINIRITGIHGSGADAQSVISGYTGMYFAKNSKQYIRYSDTDPDDGSTRNSMIVIEGKTVTVEHKGCTDAKMIYEVGKITRSMYVTPAGSMLLEIFTNSVSIKEEEDKMRINIHYSMGFGDGKKQPARIVIDAWDAKEESEEQSEDK